MSKTGLLPGKIDWRVLSDTVFSYLGTPRNDVIIGPKIGVDVAVVKTGDQLVVLKTDPISGAISRIGWLAVHVPSNDIATAGARPMWYMPCILLPEWADQGFLKRISIQMDKAARMLDVAIVGGHTEITPGLDRPIIIGCAVGIAETGRYVTSSGAKPGDVIVLTKSAGLEGSAILATDRSTELSERLGEGVVLRAQEFIERVSVVEEALLAFRIGGVNAMHDPTEGGMATGLHEIADASCTGFEVLRERIHIEEETRLISSLLDIEPLELVSSGALLITCPSQNAEPIIAEIRKRGIRAKAIGRVLQDSDRRTIVDADGSSRVLRRPRNDAIWEAIKKQV